MMQGGRAPRSVTLGDREFQLRPQEFRTWAEHQGWIADRVPGPVTRLMVQLRQAEAAGKPFTLKERRELIAVAESKAWPPNLFSDDWWGTLDHPGAAEHLLWVLLRADNPGFTKDEATETRKATSLEDLVRVFFLAYGVDIRPGGGDRPAGDADADEGEDPKGMSPVTGARNSSGSATVKAGRIKKFAG